MMKPKPRSAKRFGMGKPTSLKELFEFYYQEFKPLYSELAAGNSAPAETLYEVNAAFDHLSRFWQYGEPEAETIRCVSGHLKRGCFDAFKIILKQTSDNHDKLNKIDTSIIDNGRFDHGMHALWSEIRTLAIEARCREGDSRDVEAWHEAFDRWKEVYVRCKRFDREFFLNEHVGWARKKEGRRKWWLRVEGIVIGIVGSIAASAIWQWLAHSSPSIPPSP
jgi:hypothetical protein